jgi:hypothetical protein
MGIPRYYYYTEFMYKYTVYGLNEYFQARTKFKINIVVKDFVWPKEFCPICIPLIPTIEPPNLSTMSHNSSPKWATTSVYNELQQFPQMSYHISLQWAATAPPNEPSHLATMSHSRSPKWGTTSLYNEPQQLPQMSHHISLQWATVGPPNEAQHLSTMSRNSSPKWATTSLYNEPQQLPQMRHNISLQWATTVPPNETQQLPQMSHYCQKMLHFPHYYSHNVYS